MSRQHRPVVVRVLPSPLCETSTCHHLDEATPCPTTTVTVCAPCTAAAAADADDVSTAAMWPCPPGRLTALTIVTGDRT